MTLPQWKTRQGLGTNAMYTGPPFFRPHVQLEGLGRSGTVTGSERSKKGCRVWHCKRPDAQTAECWQDPPRCCGCVPNGKNLRQMDSLYCIGILMALEVAQIYLVKFKPAPMPRFSEASNLQKQMTPNGGSQGRKLQASCEITQ